MKIGFIGAGLIGGGLARLAVRAVDSVPVGTQHRRAIPMVGDSASGKHQVATFVDSIGFDPVDVDPLARGRMLERGGKLFNVRLDADGVRQAVAT